MFMSLCYVIYSSVISFIDRQFRVFLNGNSSKQCTINPFHANGLFLYPLETLENLWFSDVFRGYRNGPVAYNGLMQGFPQVSPLRQTLSHNKFLLYFPARISDDMICKIGTFTMLLISSDNLMCLLNWDQTYRHWLAVGKTRFISSFKDTLNAFDDFKN